MVSQTQDDTQGKETDKEDLKKNLEPVMSKVEEIPKLSVKNVKEVRFAEQTEKLISSYTFYDEISSSCCKEDEIEKTQNEENKKFESPKKRDDKKEAQDNYRPNQRFFRPRYPFARMVPPPPH